MEAQFLKYQKFFTDFSKLDKMEDTFVTFMELSGYPHFENVCSNILSFYFDTQLSCNVSACQHFASACLCGKNSCGSNSLFSQLHPAKQLRL